MHEHHHPSVNAADAEELRALAAYMLRHNTAHTEELRQIAEQLKACGYAAANDKLLKALEAYRQGNTLLQEALDAME